MAKEKGREKIIFVEKYKNKKEKEKEKERNSIYKPDLYIFQWKIFGYNFYFY